MEEVDIVFAMEGEVTRVRDGLIKVSLLMFS